MPIANFTVVGTGVIGAGWAVRALAQGLNVAAWDVAEGWRERLRTAVANAWPAAAALGLAPGADPRNLRCTATLEAACAEADMVQESAPERLDVKQKVLAAIDAAAPPEAVVASSTSGLLPTALQADCRHPRRVVVGHPFNPVYLLPLVEVLGGSRTAAECVDRAVASYEQLGMEPLRVRTEVPGFLSDRLQEALWREALHLVNDDVATTAEVDAAIAYGPGLRWAFMGTCLAFHLAGGDGGMRSFMRQFGPALEEPWTRLKAPPLTDALVDKLAAGTERQADGRTVRELERQRDQCLVAILQALRRYRAGAGETLARHEARLSMLANRGRAQP